MEGHYDPSLVILSVIVAILASYTAFLISERIHVGKENRAAWIVLGALALGSGIWAMHFIGMLAFNLPVPIHYNIPLTLVSVVPAILASWVVLASKYEVHNRTVRLIINSVMMGSGIGTMHYIGMAAMHLNGEMRHEPMLFSVSIIVAVTLSFASLKIKHWAENRGQQRWNSKRALYLAAIMMGSAISGMHYTGMASVYYFPSQHEMAGIASWDTLSFALFIALVVSFLFISLATVVYFSRRFELMKELSESENHLQNMFETIVEGIMTTDENGVLQTFNPAAEKLFGYNQAEVLGKNVSMLMPHSYAHQHDSYIRNYHESGTKKIIGTGREVEGRRKDGSVFPLELAVNVIERQGRKVFIGVTHDITERKEYERTLKKSQRRERLLKETANAANAANSAEEILQAVLNIVGEFLECQFGHVFVFQKAIFVSAGLWYMPEKRYEEFRRVNRSYRFAMGEDVPGMVAKSATHYWLKDLNSAPDYIRSSIVKVPFNSAVFFPVMVDGKASAVFEFYSVQGKVYDQELFEILDEIGFQLGYVVQRKKDEQELKKAHDAAQAASKAKSQFLATMSHEIRTPLNGVLGMLHLLKKTTLDSKQWRYVSTAAGSSEMLLTVINDILDFSKMEAGKLELESIPFDPVALVEETAALLASSAQQKGLELICTVDAGLPGLLKGDPTRLRQILTNLANNAIKFTEEGEVVIRAAKVGERVEFVVTDTGIGLTDEQQEAIFKPFTQADNATTRKFGGTGLGLAICRLLVEEMGGKLSVSSEPDYGSQFCFDLPLVALSSSQQRNAISKVLADKRVLVVDDNGTNRDVVKNILNNWHVENIDLAEAAGVALQLIDDAIDEGRPYDLGILDMQMPGMSGLELAHAIRADHRIRKMDLVMLSSVDGKGEMELLDGWLVKPVRQSELYNCLWQLYGQTSPADVVEVEKVESWWFGGRSLLLVEDNEVNQDIAREILTDAGFTVDVRDNGEQALQAIQDNNYDAVLMDIQMPVMDGYEASAQIRGLGGKYSTLPIVAMTAHALVGDREKSIEAGMNGHVTKPIDPDEIFKELARWVGMSETGGQSEGETKKEAADIDSITELPGIDLEAGLNRMRGNWPAYKRVLRIFRDKQADTATAIEQYIKYDILDEAARLAHTLKGSAGNIAAETLFQNAAKVESACHAGSQAEALAEVDGLKSEMQVVIKGLDVFEHQDAFASDMKTLREIDAAGLIGLLEQLELGLSTDLGAAQTQVEDLKGYAFDKEITNGVVAVEKAMNCFDIDEALSMVRRLKTGLQ